MWSFVGFRNTSRGAASSADSSARNAPPPQAASAKPVEAGIALTSKSTTSSSSSSPFFFLPHQANVTFPRQQRRRRRHPLRMVLPLQQTPPFHLLYRRRHFKRIPDVPGIVVLRLPATDAAGKHVRKAPSVAPFHRLRQRNRRRRGEDEGNRRARPWSRRSGCGKTLSKRGDRQEEGVVE